MLLFDEGTPYVPYAVMDIFFSLFCHFYFISNHLLPADSFSSSPPSSSPWWLGVDRVLLFSSNERPYWKEISGTTLTMISIDYPQRFAGGMGVREQGTAKDTFYCCLETATGMAVVSDVVMDGMGSGE